MAARKSALRKLRHLVERIIDDWEIPSELFFVNSREIARFENNLCVRVLPAVESGDRQSVPILSKIGEFLLSGDLTHLVKLNNWMEEKMRPRRADKRKKPVFPVFRWKDIAFMGVSVVVIITTYCVAIDIFAATRAEAVNMVIVVAVALPGIYYAVSRKQY